MFRQKGLMRTIRRTATKLLGATNPMAKNVLGTDLEDCSRDPLTGYYRDGCCNTGPGDMGVHTVCAVVTDEFLELSLIHI